MHAAGMLSYSSAFACMQVRKEQEVERERIKKAMAELKRKFDR